MFLNTKFPTVGVEVKATVAASPKINSGLIAAA